MPICTAVVGAGRMGSVVARQLPKRTKKIIIDSDREKALHLAQSIKGLASDRLESAREAEVVAIVLPTPAVNATIAVLVDIAKPESIILNMATTAHVDPALLALRSDIAIIDAKIIGHAASIAGGAPSIIVVDCPDGSKFRQIQDQLPGFHKVVQGEAARVEKINRAASTEGIRAAVRVRQQLLNLKVPEEWIDVALQTVCAGTVKAFAANDLGHFALELARKIEREEAS